MLNKIKRFKLDYVVYLLAFILFVAGATVLLPVLTDYGYQVLELVAGVFLIAYSLFYLLPKLTSKRSKLVIGFTFFEFIIVLLLGLSTILTQFDIITVKGDLVNGSLGIVLLLRGLTELVSDYVRKEHKKQFVFFLLDLAIYSLGLYLIVKPILKDTELLYILIAVFYAIGLLCLYLSIKFWPHKAKKSK